MKAPLLIIALSISIIFTNCKKGSSGATPSTNLKVTVTDNLGNPQSSAIVTLYSTQNDLTNQTSPVASSTTNSNGTVVFDNLSPVKYYWYVKSGCKDNLLGSVTSVGNLTANVTNTTTVIVSGVGILRMVSTSTNPYNIYVNGALVVNSFPGNASQDFTAAQGSYTIRVVQVSGYLITPTDETFTGTLTCGGTLVTTFP